MQEERLKGRGYLVETVPEEAGRRRISGKPGGVSFG